VVLRFASSFSQFFENETLDMVQRLKVVRIHVCVFNLDRKSFLQKEDHFERAERINDIAREDGFVVLQFSYTPARRVLEDESPNRFLYVSHGIPFVVNFCMSKLVEQIPKGLRCCVRALSDRQTSWKKLQSVNETMLPLYCGQ
jgi:hypothetical protein